MSNSAEEQEQTTTKSGGQRRWGSLTLAGVTPPAPASDLPEVEVTSRGDGTAAEEPQPVEAKAATVPGPRLPERTPTTPVAPGEEAPAAEEEESDAPAPDEGEESRPTRKKAAKKALAKTAVKVAKATSAPAVDEDADAQEELNPLEAYRRVLWLPAELKLKVTEEKTKRHLATGQYLLYVINRHWDSLSSIFEKFTPAQDSGSGSGSPFEVKQLRAYAKTVELTQMPFRLRGDQLILLDQTWRDLGIPSRSEFAVRLLEHEYGMTGEFRV